MRHPYLPALMLGACLAFSMPAQAAEPCDGIGADLAAMAGADQALRQRLDFLDPEHPAQVKLRGQLMLIDRTNTERLKTLVARCGWPTKAKYGEQAAGSAWLLAQHADHDIAFQKQALVLIEQAAADSGEGVTSNFAYLADRIAVAEKRPQPYGTQLESTSGKACDLDFSPLDDREKVEARRAALKMPTLETYKRMVLEMQHCPAGASNDHHYAADSPARDVVTRK